MIDSAFGTSVLIVDSDPDPFGLGVTAPVEDPFGLGIKAKGASFAYAASQAVPASQPSPGEGKAPASQPSPPTTQVVPSIKKSTLKISFLGANPDHADKGAFYDGTGDINAGADKTFFSLSYDEALQFVTNHFRDESPPHDLRITGFSWGGWTALILAHDLGPSYQIRMGLIDPVDTGRSHHHTRLEQIPGRHGFTSVDYGPDFGTKPANVVAGAEWHERIGLGGATGGGFVGFPVAGFELNDVTSDCKNQIDPPHIYICEHFAQKAVTFAFSDTK